MQLPHFSLWSLILFSLWLRVCAPRHSWYYCLSQVSVLPTCQRALHRVLSQWLLNLPKSSTQSPQCFVLPDLLDCTAKPMPSDLPPSLLRCSFFIFQGDHWLCFLHDSVSVSQGMRVVVCMGLLMTSLRLLAMSISELGGSIGVLWGIHRRSRDFHCCCSRWHSWSGGLHM